VPVFAATGIRYFISLPNSARDIRNRPAVPPFFWWEGPDGQSRLLCNSQAHYRNHDLYRILSDNLPAYRDAMQDFGRHVRSGDPLDYAAIWDHRNFKLDGLAEPLAEAFADILLFADTPADTLPVYFYFDHEVPNTLLQEMARTIAQHYAWPRLSMELPQTYMRRVETENGAKLPVLRGDWNDQWSDYLSINPGATAAKRWAADYLPVMETLSLLAHARQPSWPYPDKHIAETLWRLALFDEHCWPTMIPDAPMHRLNTALVKLQPAALARQTVRDLLDEALRILYAPPADELDAHGLQAVNILPRPLVTSLVLSSDDPLPLDLLTQQLCDSTRLTEPVRLPAFSCSDLDVAKRADPDKPGLLPVYDSRFETAYYRVTVWPDGHLAIWDKQSGADLLDPSSGLCLAHFVYVQNETALSPELTLSQAIYTLADIRSGPLAIEIRLHGREDISQAEIRCSVIFYRDVPDIDISVHYSHAVDFLGGFVKRYQRSIFLAIPLRLDRPSFITELGHGVMQDAQRLHISCEDFVVCQHWIAVQNEQRGVAVFSREQPVFHLGGIHYNRFAAADRPVSASLYLYAASNRTSGLYPQTESDCQADFHLSLQPYPGSWQRRIPAWSQQKTYPPLVRQHLAPAAPGLELDGAHTRLTAFKQAEKPGLGLVLRLQETGGQAETVSIRLPFAPVSAEYADLAENGNGRYADCAENTIRCTVPASGFVTLLIRSTPPDPVKPQLKAQVASDAAIDLSWDRIPGDGTAHVYMADGPARHLSGLRANLAGSVAACTYRITGLEPSRVVSCQVAAIGAWNEEGPSSDPVTVTTLAENQSAPSPVRDPFAVSTADGRVLVCWGQPPERDTARFRIERSDGTHVLVDREPDAVQFYLDSENAPDIRYRVLPVDRGGLYNRAADWIGVDDLLCGFRPARSRVD